MGNRSVIYGHIRTRSNSDSEFNRRALEIFPFGTEASAYPENYFPDIFHLEMGLHYNAPSVFFGGTFKQLEEEWPFWLHRFTTLLSTLEAVEANIILDCWFGRFAWTLNPEIIATGGGAGEISSLIGQEWWITAAPSNEEEIWHYVSEKWRELPDLKRSQQRNNGPYN